MTSILFLIGQFNATHSDVVISKTKTFSQFFSTLLQSRLNFEHFLKNMTIIADVIAELRTPKDGVR